MPEDARERERERARLEASTTVREGQRAFGEFVVFDASDALSVLNYGLQYWCHSGNFGCKQLRMVLLDSPHLRIN
eukprot:4252347-Amphidinium_carterae.1